MYSKNYDTNKHKFTLVVRLPDGRSDGYAFETKEEALAFMRSYDYNSGHGDSIFTPLNQVPTFDLYTIDDNGLMTIPVSLEDE